MSIGTNQQDLQNAQTPYLLGSLRSVSHNFAPEDGDTIEVECSFLDLSRIPASQKAYITGNIKIGDGAGPLSVVGDFSGFTSVSLISCAGVSFSSPFLLPSTVTLTSISANSCGLANIVIPSACNLLNYVSLTNNALSESAINGVLVQLDAFGTSNGEVDLDGGTNAAPSGAGITAANNLIDRGWTVSTN